MTRLVDGLLFLELLTDERHSARTISAVMHGFSSGGELHFVGVDNLSLLLHVESILVVLHIS